MEDLDIGNEQLAQKKGYDVESSRSTRSAQPAEDEKSAENIVDWDGPDDPSYPRNWATWKRISQVVLASGFVLTANLAATMFAPGAAELARDFRITNSTVETLTVSIYMLGFALGPLFIAPLSEIYGRLPVYHCCNTAYISFTIGCALSKNIGMFLAFRFIAGSAASGPLTIGGGTVADVIPPNQRGKAMAGFMLGPLMGPVAGPIIGGFVAQNIGWRWTFWLIAIINGTFFSISLLMMRETNAAILLNRQADRLRKETGNADLISKSDRGLTPGQMLLRGVTRPTKLLIFSPIIFLLALFCAYIFGLIFLLFTTFPMVFEEQYHFSTDVSGLAYLGLGVGMFIGLVSFGMLSDKMQRKQGDNPRPEGRLQLMMWISPIGAIGFFWYGWSAYERTHWIVPILGTSLIGLGFLFVMLPAQIYMVDAFGPEAAASALAANTVLRCLAAAFIPLAGPPLYANLKLGWGNSLLGFLCLAFAPVPIFFFRYGGWLREKFVVNL